MTSSDRWVSQGPWDEWEATQSLRAPLNAVTIPAAQRWCAALLRPLSRVRGLTSLQEACLKQFKLDSVDDMPTFTELICGQAGVGGGRATGAGVQSTICTPKCPFYRIVFLLLSHLHIASTKVCALPFGPSTPPSHGHSFTCRSGVTKI